MTSPLLRCANCGAELPSPGEVCARCDKALSPSAAVPARERMDDKTFWNEVQRSQNNFFLWLLAWIPAGSLVAAMYSAIAGGQAPVGLLLVLMVIWVIGLRHLQQRLCSMPCPACGRPALRNPYFLMRHAKCQHCGFAHKE